MNFVEMKKLFAKTYLDNVKLSFSGAYNMALECIEKLPEDGVKQIFSYGRPCYPFVSIEESEMEQCVAKVTFSEMDEKKNKIPFTVNQGWRTFSANGFEIYKIILNLIDDVVIFKITPYVNIHFLSDVFSDALVSADSQIGIIIKTSFFEKE